MALLFLRRMFGIIRIALSVLFKRKLSGPEKLRIFFERSGGAFVKLGQILALRQDFLPFAYATELLKLLNSIQEVPFEKMKIVFAEEKGLPIEVVFASFDPTPIACASIGQVYKARLKDSRESEGAVVAVKIQRPEARRVFEADFALVSFLAGFVDFFGIFSSLNAHEAAADFISWTRRELDFTNEARNAEILYGHSAAHPRTVIPRQYPNLSTPRVLVQEFIEDGVALEDIILNKLSERDLLEKNINPDEMAVYLIADEMRQYFIDGFFHADPHPANLLFLPENPPADQAGRLVYFDFGIVGEADERRLLFLKILYGVATKNVGLISEQFMEFGEETVSGELKSYLQMDIGKRRRAEKIFNKIKEIMADNLKTELEEVLNPWFEAVGNQNSSLKEKSAATVFLKIVNKAGDFGAQLPREAILFFRALSILDMVALQVSSRFDIIKALNFFFERYPIVEVESMIMDRTHDKDAGEKITSLTDVDWEFFREISALEKERMWAARERIVDLAVYYAEKYDEVRSMLKSLK